MNIIWTMLLDWFIVTCIIGLIVVSAVEIRTHIKENKK